MVLKDYDLSDDELTGQGNDGGINGFPPTRPIDYF